MPRPAFFLPFAKLATVALLSAAGVLVGCENEPAKSALNYTADAKRAYEVAMDDFNHHNWLEAQSEFRDVKRKFSYSKYAKLAELRIADADFAQEKYAEAVREFRQFIHDHRSDNEDVAYARSKIAEAEFMQIPDSFLLPAPEERDQGQLMDAYKELRGFLHDYPDAKESARVRELLGTVTARLIKHELYVARFYLAKDNYPAAVARVEYALRNFSAAAESSEGGPVVESGLEPEALLLLGETFLKMHKWTEARQSFATILARYPASALTTHAKGYLEFMKQKGV